MKLRHLNANYFTFAVLRTKTNTPSFVQFQSMRLTLQQCRNAFSVRKKINKFAFRRVNIIFFRYLCKCITKHSKDVLNEIEITTPRLVIQ